MAESTKIVAETRETKGTSASRGMRRDGMLPGIVYSSDTKSTCIQLNRHDFEVMLHHHKSEHLIMDLVVDGKEPLKVLLKEVQHHPVSGDVLHADFMEISMTEKMIVPIRVVLTGEPVGVVQQGGILEQMLREIEVECLPSDLVEQVELDVSGLEIGDSLLVKDVSVGSKIDVLTSGDVAVASVMAPRVEEEPEEGEDAEGGEGEEAAEGEGKEGKKGQEEGDGKEGDSDKKPEDGE